MAAVGHGLSLSFGCVYISFIKIRYNVGYYVLAEYEHNHKIKHGVDMLNEILYFL